MYTPVVASTTDEDGLNNSKGDGSVNLRRYAKKDLQ